MATFIEARSILAQKNKLLVRLYTTGRPIPIWPMGAQAMYLVGQLRIYKLEKNCNYGAKVRLKWDIWGSP